MSLVEEIVESKKIDGKGKLFLLREMANEDVSKESLSLFFTATASARIVNDQILDSTGNSLPGVRVITDIRPIFTARASLTGLKALIDHSQVASVQLGQKLSL